MACCSCWPFGSSSYASDDDEGALHQPLIRHTIISEPLRPFSCAGHPELPPSSSDDEDLPRPCPHTFNDVFILQTQIGKGSTATCYKCVHRKSGALLSVKVIDKRRIQLNYSAVLLNQFRLEVDILRSLSHPNIIKLFECFENTTDLHMITEYVPGGELFDYLVARPDRLLSEAEASGIVRQIAQAVAYLHYEHIMHRDIKLENVLVARRPVEEDGEVFPQVKLIDFGLAKRFDADTDRVKYTTQTYFGTIGYIAPEMNTYRGYNHAVDVWALGVLTYVLLCGMFPFDDGRAVANYQVKYPPWNGEISKSAKELLERLLCVDVAKRYTASKACKHEWVAGATASRLALLGTPKMLENFRLNDHYGVKDLIKLQRIIVQEEEEECPVSPLTLDRQQT